MHRTDTADPVFESDDCDAGLDTSELHPLVPWSGKDDLQYSAGFDADLAEAGVIPSTAYWLCPTLPRRSSAVVTTTVARLSLLFFRLRHAGNGNPQRMFLTSPCVLHRHGRAPSNNTRGP